MKLNTKKVMIAHLNEDPYQEQGSTRKMRVRVAYESNQTEMVIFLP